MIKQKPSSLVKVFKVGDRQYGYDAASTLLCELDDLSAECLRSGLCDTAPETLGRLLARGVFATPAFQQCTVSLENVPRMVEYNMEHVLPKRFVLEVTERCNLRCKYCFNTIGNRVRVHTQRQIDEDTAFAAIDYYFKCFTEKISKVDFSERKSCLEKLKPIFSFWGGEPFLHFGLIKKAKAYLDNLPWETFGVDKNHIICSIVTNFTVFNEEILDFLLTHQVALTISLDGDRVSHDANRVFINDRGSFDVVRANVEKLYLLAPDYCRRHVSFHAVYDGKEELEKSQDFYGSYLYDDRGKLRFLGVSYLDQSKPQECMDFSVSSKDEEKAVRLFNEKMTSLSLLEEREMDARIQTGGIVINDYLDLFKLEKKLCFDMPRATNRCARTFACQIGTAQVAVGVEGDIQVCYKSDGSYPLGNVRTGGVEISKLVGMYLEYYKNFQGDCKQCWAFRFCQKCPSDILRNGKFVAFGREECEYIRKVARVTLIKYVLFAANERLYNIVKKYYSPRPDGMVYV